MVMRQMRENTKWIMLITALAFVALMVFEWGMDATGRSGAQVSGGEIGRVAGQPVTYEEYMLTYRNLYNQQQAAMGGQTISPAMNDQIEDRAWEQLVTDKLIQRELERRGIRVTNEEIRQAARSVPPAEFMSNPMFLTDGQFDMNKYTQFLASPAVDNQLLLQLEAYYRDIIPRSKLYFQVVAGTHLTEGDLWQMFRDANETASVRFLAFDPNLLVPDEAVTVTDQEIERWYRSHEDDLQRAAQANVRFIAFPKAPTAADSARVRTRVDSLRTAINNGADFAAAASAVSADSASAANGGELTIRRGQTVPEFEQAAFSRPLGQVGEPVRTMYGWHLLRVDARGGDSAVVRHILLPIERSLESEDALFARADSMDALSESRSLDEIARTDAALSAYDGQATHPFRPPSGELPANLLLHFARIGRTVAFWSYDSHDYELLPAAELLPQIRANPPRSGDNVLMHDDSAITVELLASLLPQWRDEGFAIRAMPRGHG